MTAVGCVSALSLLVSLAPVELAAAAAVGAEVEPSDSAAVDAGATALAPSFSTLSPSSLAAAPDSVDVAGAGASAFAVAPDASPSTGATLTAGTGDGASTAGGADLAALCSQSAAGLRCFGFEGGSNSSRSSSHFVSFVSRPLSFNSRSFLRNSLLAYR